MKKRKEFYDRRSRPRLYRSREDVVIAGIAGGVGKYLGIDPGFLRVSGVILLFVTGILPGLIAYAIATLVIPKDSERRSTADLSK
jgi:phage shock protein C